LADDLSALAVDQAASADDLSALAVDLFALADDPAALAVDLFALADISIGDSFMSNDWMPSSRSAQLAMAKRWLGLLPGKADAWRIPDGMIEQLDELAVEAEALQDRADSPEGTKGDAARAIAAFHELVAQMRDIRRRVFFMPPLAAGDYADLGLKPPDTIRTPHIDVPEMVDFVIHLSNIRELVVNFWIQGSPHRAKPHGYDGAVIIWDIRDTPPENPMDLAFHTMASRTPHTLTFDEAQRGRTVQIALAWQNERGILGQWSEYKSAIIP